ncbi:MAG: polyprenyl synthetase family protein [Cyanobacteria bacterium TGS_CYA1]|nr:polyprenyl synthetase family protein [Cyanobacteria bacterium TGS_CYA1]
MISPGTKSKSQDLTPLIELVHDEMQMVEDWLATNLIDDNPFVGELLKQIFQAGGKRLRPLICLLSGKATSKNNEIGRLHIILAVLTELIHTASLVHDDVIDSSDLRRGKETINKKWNERVAVLMGDLLFAQASICLARLMNPPIVGIYGQVLGDLCAGEIKQMRHQFNIEADWDTYIQKSIGKTASLFSAASHSAAILNGKDNDTVLALKSYGLNLGICFQIVDDMLDITGDFDQKNKAGGVLKPVGGDLRNGVLTAPVLYALGEGGKDSQRLRKLIEDRTVVEDAGNQEGLSIISRSGAIEKTAELAQKYADDACRDISVLPDSPYKEGLCSLTEFIMSRAKPN